MLLKFAKIKIFYVLPLQSFTTFTLSLSKKKWDFCTKKLENLIYKMCYVSRKLTSRNTVDKKKILKPNLENVKQKKRT